MGDKASRIKRQWSIWYPKKAENLLEKSVANVTRMRFFQTYFKPAYFIYIVRNGYAVSEGIRRRARLKRGNNQEYRDSYPIELCANQWRATDELVEHDLGDIQNFLQIYYENLVSDPSAVLKQITSFIGIRPMPPSVFEQSWTIGTVISTIRDMNSESLERLTSEDIQKIHQAAGAVLRKHGYIMAIETR